MGPAARLIADEKNFQQGSLYRDRNGVSCIKGRGQVPEIFDGLGAFLWAYRKMPVFDRRVIARMLFDACRERHGHTRVGRLVWEEAFDLLKGCGL